MTENRTRSILQRLPIILAVTSASYGLPAQGTRPTAAKSADGTSAKAFRKPSTARPLAQH